MECRQCVVPLFLLPRVGPKGIGQRFGHGTAKEVTRSGAPLVGVLGFRGNHDTQNRAAAMAIRAKAVVCHAEDDPSGPSAEVAAFQREMNKRP